MPTARQLELWYDWACTIQAARQRAGLTQATLADRLGVSRRTVEGWEAGRRSIPLDVRRDLCRVLEIPRDKLGCASDYCGCCGHPL